MRLSVAPMSLMPAYVSWIAAFTLLILPAAMTGLKTGIVYPSLALIEIVQIITYPGLMPLSVAASFVYVDVVWAVGVLLLMLQGSHRHSMACMGRLQWQSAPVETRHDLQTLGLDLCRTALGWPVYTVCGSIGAFCYCAAEAGMGKAYVVATLIALASAMPIAFLGNLLGRLWFQKFVCPKELNSAIDDWFRAEENRYAKPNLNTTN